MVQIGTLEKQQTVQISTSLRKRLTIIFSYGGQVSDLEAALVLIAKNQITPQVELGRLDDFPRWLTDLCEGRVKARVALSP